MSGGEWTVVQSRKKSYKSQPRRTKKNGGIVAEKNAQQVISVVLDQPKVEMEILLQQVRRAQKSLRDTKYHKDCIAVIKANSNTRFERIVMLGIGSFASSPACLLQLSFGLLLIEEFHISNPGLIVDPVMGDFEQRACSALGLLTAPEQPDIHEAHTKTLFFMPHCPYMLYNQILWKNWGDNLHNVEILGNSFESYFLRRIGLADIRLEVADCIKKLTPLTEEFVVWSEAHVRDDVVDSSSSLHCIESAFNDLSFLRFCKEWEGRASLVSSANRPSDDDMRRAIECDLEVINV